MEFEGFPKIPRYKRNIIITEKLDGTNAQVAIEEAHVNDWPDSDNIVSHVEHEGTYYNIYAGSRKRWLRVGDDNFGFASWVEAFAQELVKLGPGRHYGEWWGQGIQRRYGLDHKRFSLFNVGRWSRCDSGKPECCHVVPLMYMGPHTDEAIEKCFNVLREHGSVAVTNFDNPEGIVVYHAAGKNYYKITLERDEAKGQ